MRFYYKIQGVHVRVRVFTTGSKCGDLCFTVQEWNATVYTLLTRIGHVNEED